MIVVRSLERLVRIAGIEKDKSIAVRSQKEGVERFETLPTKERSKSPGMQSNPLEEKIFHHRAE